METKFNFETDFPIVPLNHVTLEADSLERAGDKREKQFMCLNKTWM